jgi:DNA helicase-2/ATP-dependent DNA helicase PcrA
VGLSEVRAALRSAEPRVVVEAPAGCGKTFEAVSCAIDLAAGLGDHQEVLLLAHTNVAVAEFKRRARSAGARVHATTIDAFALSLVAPYATALGLPAPLIVGDLAGEVPFGMLAPKAMELITRAPSIGSSLRRHYPVILLDEHQDARQDQHDLAMKLGESGRVRLFGDPMQAIYGFNHDELIGWDSVANAADRLEALEEPQRWREEPELGEWILAARQALSTGRRLSLSEAPPCVRLVRVEDLDDVPNPMSSRVPPAIIRPLGRRLHELDGSAVVLTRYNAHVRGLFSAVRGSLVVQEGVDFSAAYAALSSAEAAVGDPRRLAEAATELLVTTCRGVDASVRSQLSSSLLSDRCDRGKRRRVGPLLDALEPLYQTPDLPTWSRAVGEVLRSPPEWLKIDLPASLRILGGLRPQEGETLREALDAAARHRHDSGGVPRRCASTIHKAKGQEFDHVLLAHCSAGPFPDTSESRRLLYVALSRACRSITIIASGKAPSPLLH